MRLLLVLAFVFIALPWLEIVILLEIADSLGFPAMLGLVLVTGAAGAAVARQQGTAAWRSVRRAWRAGRLPSNELFDGVCILCAGLLLITPGLLTDATGFCLLIPGCRAVLRRIVFRRLKVNLHKGMVRVDLDRASTPGARSRREGAGEGDIIDVNGETVDMTDVE